MGRSETTKRRVREAAMALFAERGFEASTTATIAERAGVSEMTLFRHFASKEALITDDPYDPAIANAVRARPAGESPMRALVEGIWSAWAEIPHSEVDELRERLRIVADTPSLRGALSRSSADTVSALSEALTDRGAEPIAARVATEAVIAGLGEALLQWAKLRDSSLHSCIDRALTVLDGGS